MTSPGPPTPARGGPEGFTKTREGAPPLFFDREAAGLRALAAAGARVPAVLSVDARHITITRIALGGRGGSGGGGTEDTGATELTELAVGRELAALHRHTGERYGGLDGEPTGYLGDCPVDLTPCDTFAVSWLTRRVVPLTRQAAELGALPGAAVGLAERLGPEHLAPPEPPTLVHGDLWAGNRVVDAEGRNWLIDPAAHYAHREVDLAMMRLFGGFGERAFDAYAEAFAPAAGWRDRVPVHQTVPLLVHAILFGGGYGSSAHAALQRALEVH